MVGEKGLHVSSKPAFLDHVSRNVILGIWGQVLAKIYKGGPKDGWPGGGQGGEAEAWGGVGGWGCLIHMQPFSGPDPNQ